MNKEIGQPETEEQRILDEDQEYQEWLDMLQQMEKQNVNT